MEWLSYGNAETIKAAVVLAAPIPKGEYNIMRKKMSLLKLAHMGPDIQ